MGKCGQGGKHLNGCFMPSLKQYQLQGNPLLTEAEPLHEVEGGAEARLLEREAEQPRGCKRVIPQPRIRALNTDTPHPPWLKAPSNPASVSYKTPLTLSEAGTFSLLRHFQLAATMYEFLQKRQSHFLACSSLTKLHKLALLTAF